VALQEIYEVDCVRTADGSVIRCYELRSHPLPGQETDHAQLVQDAQSNMTDEGLANPPYRGITFTVRLIEKGEI
jgi:hypothetical protein